MVEDNERLIGSKPWTEAFWKGGGGIMAIIGVKFVSRVGLKGTENCAAWAPLLWGPEKA